MSCNGCRVLRKGCSDQCMLRHCLEWIENPQSQAHATLFVAKFFGRAALMSFISSVPTSQRSALFQSLLFEAVGRTLNPVSGAVGLLWTGNWHLCQKGMEMVLRGSTLTTLPQLFRGVPVAAEDDGGVESIMEWSSQVRERGLGSKMFEGKVRDNHMVENFQSHEPDLCLVTPIGGKLRAATPSEESQMTILASSVSECGLEDGNKKLLTLFI